MYKEIIDYVLSDDFNPKYLERNKIKIARKYKLSKIPSNFSLLLSTDNPLARKRLQTKPVRSQSGVVPVAIMTKPASCPHGRCTYCPGGLNSEFGDVPQSYTGHEPASLRGKRNNYDAYLQVFNRLEQYIVISHVIDKVEMIVMGGTFPAMPIEYQNNFIRDAFAAMNDFSDMFFEGDFMFEKFKEFFMLPGEVGSEDRTRKIHEKLLNLKQNHSLEYEQKRNETAKVRCVALCIETRPDYGMEKEGQVMLSQGCTRVELGIQSVYDDVLQRVNRGHKVSDSVRSIRILKDMGFKVNFHYMPGLPGVDYEREVRGFEELFSNPDFKPDMIKLYPCMVSKGTKLYDEYKEGKFKPIDAKEAVRRITFFKSIVPEYCRIQRVQRDVPTKMWSAGVEFTNLRQMINVKCRCIRCREPKGQVFDDYELKVQRYDASHGIEYFASAESDDKLLGFCRLRFTSEGQAIIREMHVYGSAASIGDKGSVQHKGIGKMLLCEAERICKGAGKKRLLVISGVGVREYYRKLGYTRAGYYMSKEL